MTATQQAAAARYEYRVCPPDADAFTASSREGAVRDARRIARKTGRTVFVDINDLEDDEDLPVGLEVLPNGRVRQG